MSHYKSISINDDEFEAKLIKLFREEGLVVVNDVFTDDECNNWMDEILDYFQKLGTGIDVKTDKKIKETWTQYNLPPQTRSGMFQSLVSNIPACWSVRSHDNVSRINKVLYEDLRNETIDKFMVSNDGINIKPNCIGPYNSAKQRDWPHLDQTSGDIFKCIQGQAVLTNTTASFRASPNSHLVFKEILKKNNIGDTDKTNWLKLKNTSDVIQLVESVGGEWQIPLFQI